LGATGASGQGTGLEVGADVVLPGLVSAPLGDTGLQSATPPTLSFDETASVVSLTGGVDIGVANLKAGIITGHTEGNLQLNTVDSSAGVATDPDSGTAGLDLSVSLLNLLGVTADAVVSQAHASCNAGTPVFSSSTEVANLNVDALGSSLATANGSIAPNTVLLDTDISVPILVGSIKVAELKLILHEQTTTADSIEVNALRLQLTVLGLDVLGITLDALDLDLKVGTSMAQLNDCAAADPGGVDIDIQAADINSSNETAVPVTGICTPGSSDDVHITATDGTTTTTEVTASCAADGTYSADVDASGLADGTVTFTATQDGASATDTVNKDTSGSGTTPFVSITSATDPIDAGNETNVATGGYCAAGQGDVTVTFTDGTTDIGPTDTSCEADGSWNLSGTDASSLADGTIIITATQGSDPDQATDTREVTKDSSSGGTTPSVSITSATDPIDAGNETAVTVGGDCTAGEGDVTVSLTDGTTSIGPFSASCSAGGSWNLSGIDASSLADGTITITASQGSGPDQATDTRAVTKDTADQDVDVVSVPVGGLLWSPLLALAMGLGVLWRRRKMTS